MLDIGIIGAGSWGTALAIHLSRLGHNIRLWVRRNELAREIAATRLNPTYSSGHLLPESILVTSSMEEATTECAALLLAVPSHTLREIAQAVKRSLRQSVTLISAVKGIENSTLFRMSEVLHDVFDSRIYPVLALSGPSFAEGVLRGDPTAIALASADPTIGHQYQRELSGNYVRLYINQDMIGTELGGAVKNVIAIAAGVLSGLGYGHNTIAALVTRGLAEMQRLAIAAGGYQGTLAGLAGLGDLLLTCTGHLSRNRQLGIALGKGQKLDAVLANMHMVAEGVKTAKATMDLAQRYDVVMPIVEQICAILYEDVPPHEAIRKLMERELKQEEWR